MSDRIIGYTVIFTVIILLFLPAGYLIWQSATPKVERTIVFKDVKGLSFLSIQDPVSVLGVDVGLVKAIAYKKNAAHVTIETSKDLKIFNNYRIQVLAKGVMGERFLTIDAGSGALREVPLHEVLQGTVSVGPDEALSYIGLLAMAVHQLAELSTKLRYGTAGNQSLISQVWEVSLQMDTLVTKIQTLFVSTDSALSKNITRVTTLIAETDLFLNTLSDSLPATATALEKLIADINTLISRVDPLLQKSGQLVHHIESPDNHLWKTYKSSLHDKLVQLQVLLNQISADSLSVPIRLW